MQMASYLDISSHKRNKFMIYAWLPCLGLGLHTFFCLERSRTAADNGEESDDDEDEDEDDLHGEEIRG